MARDHLTAPGPPAAARRFAVAIGRSFCRLRETRPLLRRKLAWLLIITVLALLGLLTACDFWIRTSTRARIFYAAAEVPVREFALVLGTSPEVADGRPNLFFVYRMEAAAELYHQGKVQRLILSGGARAGEYDEPEEMRSALLAAGLPADALILDRAGFRTYDSVVRAREVFGAGHLVVISQKFHAARAIFIADRQGIEAVAFAAGDVPGFGGMKVNLRETLARVKAIMDLYFLRPSPESLEPQ